MENRSIIVNRRVRSFGHALEGLRLTFLGEVNMRIHAAAAILITIAGLIKGLSPMEWVAIFFCIALVWVAEIFNTCIEKLCDLYCGHQYHAMVKTIKDMAAGGVLVVSMVSIITGVLIFLF